MPSPPCVLERATRLPFAAETVFAWHERPGALERLTPPWEHVRVIGRSGGIEDGASVVLQVICLTLSQVRRSVAGSCAIATMCRAASSPTSR